MTISRRGFLVGASAAALAGPAIIGRAQADDTIRFVSILDQSGGLDIYGKPMVDATRMRWTRSTRPVDCSAARSSSRSNDPQSTIQYYTQYATRPPPETRPTSCMPASPRPRARPSARPSPASRFCISTTPSTRAGCADFNCFCTGSTPAQTVEKLVPHTMSKWGKKVYIVAADYNYGQITAQWVRKYVADNGGEAVETEFFPLDVTNFGPTIKKIQAAKPDMVMSALVGGAHVSFYRQYAAAGMSASVPIASTTFGVGNEHKLISAEEGNGMICAYSYFEEIDTPANRDFTARFKAHMGGDAPALNELAARSWEGAWLWAEAVKQAGTAERLPVIEALRSGLGIDGPSGRVTIEPKTNHALQTVHLAELKDQAFDIIETHEAQPPTDTALVCDLVADPNQAVFKFENGLEAAGIEI